MANYDQYFTKIIIEGFKEHGALNYKICFLLSECAFNMSLPSLSPSVACHILETCLGITCCVENKFLQRTFQIYFELDPCSSKLSLGIENVFYNTTLTDFKWGRY